MTSALGFYSPLRRLRDNFEDQKLSHIERQLILEGDYLALQEFAGCNCTIPILNPVRYLYNLINLTP
jgi:hypothetical protein